MSEAGRNPSEAAASEGQGPLDIRGIDHIEFYVANPKHTEQFYRTTLGVPALMRSTAETSPTHQCAYGVASAGVRLVFTGTRSTSGAVADYLRLHGDGVRDIAFRVDDAEAAFHAALGRGANAIAEPAVQRSGDRTIKRASVAAFGDVVHSFVERDDEEWFLPGLASRPTPGGAEPCGIVGVDHLALAVAEGTLTELVESYKTVFGFHEVHHEYVTTGATAMNSTVVESTDGRVRLPIVEGAAGRRKSQVQEYVDLNCGPGVQHVAFLSDDIIRSVAALRTRGIDFLPTPATYYTMLRDRFEALPDNLAALQELGVLIDQDEWGHLLQVFSQPTQARPTFFLEVIQRRGARGFGSGNIKALFEAVEREQMSRSTIVERSLAPGSTATEASRTVR